MRRHPLIDGLKRAMGPHRWTTWRRRYWETRQRLDDRIDNYRNRGGDAPKMVFVSEVSNSRHGYWYFLDWLARERPLLRQAIHVDRLPCPLPEGVTLFHAWVRDPVIERAPSVHQWLESLEAECARRGVAVVHPARVLSNSKREVLCQRLEQVGVRTPRTVVVDEAFDTHRGGLGLPMLVRRRWGHGGCMQRLDTDAALAGWWEGAKREPGSWVAGEYVDVRNEDGCYRKYRYFMAGSHGNARHLIVSPHWEVRPKDRVLSPQTREEELAFVSSPCAHHALFDAARRALEFEIAAFDFSYDAHGDLVVWEVNPYPDLSRPRGDVGSYLAPTVERSYAILADFYSSRAHLTMHC